MVSSHSTSPSSAWPSARRVKGGGRAIHRRRSHPLPTPAQASAGRARASGVGGTAIAWFALPVNAVAVIARDRDLPAQAIERQALHQLIGRIRLAIEDQPLPVRPDEEIEQRLALRGEQPGPGRQRAGDVVGDEALEESCDRPRPPFRARGGRWRGKRGELPAWVLSGGWIWQINPLPVHRPAWIAG